MSLTLGNSENLSVYSSATQIAEAIKTGQTTSEAITLACLRRIGEVNEKINAVFQLQTEAALEQAKQADTDLARGIFYGPLHGLPMTTKDSFDTAGVVSTAGTLGRKNYIPSKDATIVERLKSAGAILLGKTNTPELTLAGHTDNLVYGWTSNPYALDRSPGASSGGAAAIVSAGGAAFDIGTDTGGSIRLPSHYCGLCGIKPTSGRVARTGHIISYDSYDQFLTTIGPIARYVEDLKTILPIISGPDGIDPYVYDIPIGFSEETKLEDLKFCFFTDNDFLTPCAEVVRTVKDVARELEKTGAVIEAFCPEVLQETLDMWLAVITADGGYTKKKILADSGTEQTSKHLKWLSELSMDEGIGKFPQKDFADMFERWAHYQSRVTSAFFNFDIIVCPVSAVPAPKADYESIFEVVSYVGAFNLTGWPAVTVPAGMTKEGLPIGVQIVGKPWEEAKILAVAEYIEKLFGGYKPPAI
ncbi:amidase [Rubellicoccus peritrichatus]|uniref:Amidase n=1 Tax=Rubellicoccus peritrichatus TaxID=3080537 RepID=A0AAQ3LK27_9BACT|nr:amidase [Puniceicoccus sp. CR14]WOO43714.1 amidase [Puniceicoccus sp. CR14]